MCVPLTLSSLALSGEPLRSSSPFIFLLLFPLPLFLEPLMDPFRFFPPGPIDEDASGKRSPEVDGLV